MESIQKTFRMWISCRLLWRTEMLHPFLPPCHPLFASKQKKNQLFTAVIIESFRFYKTLRFINSNTKFHIPWYPVHIYLIYAKELALHHFPHFTWNNSIQPMNALMLLCHTYKQVTITRSPSHSRAYLL